MQFVDTHTHLYLNAFDNDRDKAIQNAINRGVEYMLLPNIDSASEKEMNELCKAWPDNCFPMMGLHPTSVKENFREELKYVTEELESERNYIAVGEIGIDLYWDKTFLNEQVEALEYQIELAKRHQLPVVIHQRDSFDEIMEVFKGINTENLRGVFHCFTGSREQAESVIDMGFLLGIGGVLTFKNSRLSEVLKEIDLKHIVLETDAPFLAPMPYRGKRNESAYVFLIARKLAEIKGVELNKVAEVTTANAKELFNFVS